MTAVEEAEDEVEETIMAVGWAEEEETTAEWEDAGEWDEEAPAEWTFSPPLRRETTDLPVWAEAME